MREQSIGQRVEVTDGPLKGEKATIVQVDGWDGHVLIEFDRESTKMRDVPTHLLTQWFKVAQLKESESI